MVTSRQLEVVMSERIKTNVLRFKGKLNSFYKKRKGF